MASRLLSPYHLRTWDFRRKWGFWTDSSDSCALKGLMGASTWGSLLWFVIWWPGTNKNPWSLTTSLPSPHNLISEPVHRRRKWKHSWLKFPRRLYSFIKSISCFTPFLRFSTAEFNGSLRSDSTTQCHASGLQIYCTPGCAKSCRQASHRYRSCSLFKGHTDNEHRLPQRCGC